MRIRLIIVSTEDGDRDRDRDHVIFTEDFASDVDSWCERHQVVDFDQIIDAELPSSFPIESYLLRD